MKTKKIKSIILFFSILIFSCLVSFIPNKISEGSKVYAHNIQESYITSFVDEKGDNIKFVCPKDYFSSDLELNDFLEENDYFYYEEGENYYFYNKFLLKCILVKGNIDLKSYKNALKLGKNEYMLCFDTQEETEIAYNELINLKDVEISLDKLQSASITDNWDADYEAPGSISALSWGYDAMEVAPYIDYLNQNSTREVVVAVVDTGINVSHEMFTDRLARDSAGNIIGFGYSDGSINTNYIDGHGHGTHVSGIICDNTPSNVKIMPVKFLDDSGRCTISVNIFNTVFTKILELEEQYDIDVVCVNMSLSTDNGQSASFVSQMNAMFESTLISKGVLPVVAASNDQKQLNSSFAPIPASCESVVTVSALKKDENDNYVFDSSYSNYGEVVDISAPGSYINSAFTGGSNVYEVHSGTSMATPHVAAVVAMLFLDPLYDGGVTASVVENRLYELTVDLGSTGKDQYYGYGMPYLKYFKGEINYEVSQTTVTYDGNYYNIDLTVNGVSDYEITYGFSLDDITISNFRTNSKFKNWTNGNMRVYFKISADHYSDVIGFSYLTIKKADRKIALYPQNGVYGETPSLDQTKYVIDGTIFSGDDLGVEIYTSATNKSVPGDYPLSFSYTNTNYNLTTSATSYYKVKRRDIAIKISAEDVCYGDSISSGTKSYMVTSGSLTGLEPLNVKYKYVGTSFNAGDTVEVSIDSYNDSCYRLTWTSGEIRILKRSITISLTNSKVYGDTITFDLNGYTVQSGSVVNSDVLIYELSTTATQGSDVGEYPIDVISSNENYDITISSKIYKITKRKAYLKIGNQTSVYGEYVNFDESNYTLANVYASDDLNILLSTTAHIKSSVGSYLITASYSNDNYNLSISNGILTIAKRDISIKFYQIFNYGDEIEIDTTRALDVSNSLVAGDKLNLSLTTDAKKYSGVGTYSLSVLSNNSNYNVNLTSDSFVKIVPRPISVIIGNKESYYGNSVSLYGVQVDLSEVLNSDNLNQVLTTSANEYSNVGDYDIDLTYNNINYDVDVIKGNLKIIPRLISVKIIKSFVYGEDIDLTNIDYQITQNSIVNNDELNLIVSTDAKKYSDVASYGYKVISNNENYFVTISSSSYLKITSRPITVKIGNTSSKFNDAIDLTKVSVDTSEVLNNDDLKIVLSTTATSSSKAGDYPINASYDNSNYSVTFIKGVYTIYSRQLHITILKQSSYYGDVITLDNSAYTLDETDVDDLNLVLETNCTNLSDVGNYEITIKSYNKNYEVLGDNGVYEIMPRPISISFEQSSVYGDKINLNPNNFTIIQGEIVNSDSLVYEISTDAQLNSEVGDYSIKLIDYNNNYEIQLIDGAYKITPRLVALTITQTVVYGDDINLDLNNFSVVSGSVINGDVLINKLSSSAQKGSNVGTYSIQVEENNKNYNITLRTGRLTITKRVAEIEISDVTKKYGDSLVLDENIYTLKNVYNNDDLNIKLSSQVTEKSSVGSFPINVSFSNNNYQLNYANKAYVIVTPKDASLRIGNISDVQYGSFVDVSEVSYQTDGVLKNDDLVLSFSTLANSSSPVGNYEISAISKNVNYNLTIFSGSLTIIPRDINLEISQSGVYGDEHIIDSEDFKVLNGNIVNNDNLNLSLVCDVTVKSTVGEYAVSLTSANENYNVNLSKAVYNILPKNIDVVVSDVTAIYGDEIDKTKISADLKDVLFEDDLNLEFSYSAGSTSSVGSYPISANYNNINYIVNFVGGEIIVSKRPLTIKIQKEITYGEEIGEFTDYLIVSGSVVNGDELNLSLSCEATINSNVGLYSFNVDSNNPNYLVSMDSGSGLNIVPRDIIIKINKSVEYGEKIEFNVFDYEVINGEIVDGDLLISVVSLDINKLNVGDYEIYIKKDLNDYIIVLKGENDLTIYQCNKNYDITLSESILNIFSREVNIIVKDKEKFYGENVVFSDNDYTIESYVSGDLLNVTFKTNVTSLSDVGEYEIWVEINNDNYNINVVKGIFFVRPLPIKIKIFDVEKVYGDLVSEFNFECIEEGVEKDKLGVNLGSDAGQFSSVGEYPIVVVEHNKNYDIQTEGGAVKILPRKIKVNIVNQEKGHFTFNKPSQKKYEIVSGEIVGNDDIDIEIETDVMAYLFWGNFELTGLSNNGNYEIEFENGELKVKYSFVDTSILSLISAIILCIIIIIIVKKIKRSKENIKVFKEQMKYLKKNNPKD